MSAPDADHVVIPSVLSRWFVEFRDDLLAGRVDLQELLECTDHDMQTEQPVLCPVCGRHPVRDRYKTAERRGECAICYLYQLRESHLERLKELITEREVMVAKQQVCRCRNEVDPDRERRPRVIRECASCGRKFAVPVAVNPDETRCIACREQHERRHPEDKE